MSKSFEREDLLSKELSPMIYLAEVSHCHTNPRVLISEASQDDESVQCRSSLPAVHTQRRWSGLTASDDEPSAFKKVRGSRILYTQVPSSNSSSIKSINTLASPVGSTDSFFSNICRICHEGRGPQEPLIRVCLCAGSIRHVHHSCLLNWIAISGDLRCELCHYEYRVIRTGVRRRRFKTWRYPAIGLKGCLHIVLFVAFLIMFLTSFVWIVWCQTSDSSAAIKERNSPEVKYAYLLNGVFMLTALTGMILDSFRHLRKYIKKVLALNQKIVIMEYFSQREKSSSLCGSPLPVKSGRCSNLSFDANHCPQDQTSDGVTRDAFRRSSETTV